MKVRPPILPFPLTLQRGRDERYENRGRNSQSGEVFAAVPTVRVLGHAGGEVADGELLEEGAEGGHCCDSYSDREVER